MKIAEEIHPCGRLHSTFWSNLSTISVFGVLHPCRCTDGVKFGKKEGTDRCNVSPLRGEKSQNRPLSKLNTGGLAARNVTGKEVNLEAGVKEKGIYGW